MKNKEICILHRGKEERNNLYEMKRRVADWIGHTATKLPFEIR